MLRFRRLKKIWVIASPGQFETDIVFREEQKTYLSEKNFVHVVHISHISHISHVSHDIFLSGVVPYTCEPKETLKNKFENFKYQDEEEEP